MTASPFSAGAPLEPLHPDSPYLPPPPPPGEHDPVLIQMLEALHSQNQLLIDLLAAVNGLTSAILCQAR